VPDKLTDSEKKKIKQENKAKANPALAAGKKEKSDAKRERRKVRGMPSHAAKQPTPSHAACHAPCGAHAWPHTTCTCYVPLRSRRPSLPAVPRPHPSSATTTPPPPLCPAFAPAGVGLHQVLRLNSFGPGITQSLNQRAR
jgi:hypothetical protein